MRKLETRFHTIGLVAGITAGLFACSGTRQSGVTPSPSPARAESVAMGVPNLYDAQRQVDQYIQSGRYDEDVAKVVADARGWLEERAKTANKPAIVLDIDETSLSNYDAIQKDNFTFGPNSQAEATAETGVKIPSTLELFNLAKQNGVAVFFITGRRENTRAHTESNLRREGYDGWQQLFLKPDASTETTVQYKSGARAAIEGQGYRIVANVGDQYSDLAGGHEDIGFKLANPFYFLP
jgi:predicted secreted acid phosphatase